MSGGNAADPLPTADRDIHIDWVQLDYPGDAARTLGRQDRRAAAAEWVEDDAVTPAAIADQIGDEGDRFDSGMQIKIRHVGPGANR